jgi:hypothetical protein
MAETLISRGMLYTPSRTTVVLVVVMDCILYSSTTSSSPDSQEMMMEKLSGWKFSVLAITLGGGDGAPTDIQRASHKGITIHFC